MNRRSFLRLAGGAGLAVVTAPLFIPAERLDFGVPTGRLVVPEPISTSSLTMDQLRRLWECGFASWNTVKAASATQAQIGADAWRLLESDRRRDSEYLKIFGGEVTVDCGLDDMVGMRRRIMGADPQRVGSGPLTLAMLRDLGNAVPFSSWLET